MPPVLAARDVNQRPEQRRRERGVGERADRGEDRDDQEGIPAVAPRRDDARGKAFDGYGLGPENSCGMSRGRDESTTPF